MNTLRIVCLILAAGVLGLVGWRSETGHPPAASGPPPPLAALKQAMLAPAAALPRPALPVVAPPVAAPPVALPPALVPPEERAEAVPEFASFYERLKAEFPRDYTALLGRREGAGTPPGANAAIWETLRALEQSRGLLAAHAQPAELDRFFDARSAMLDGLAPLNARQCVDFLYGVTDASIADFTAAHRGLVATLAERTLDAIADGRNRHDDRSAPTPTDLDALAAGLASRGLSPIEVGLLLDGITPDVPIPEARVCEIGRVYLDVLHGLPAETRQRIYGLAAELLARS